MVILVLFNIIICSLLCISTGLNDEVGLPHHHHQVNENRKICKNNEHVVGEWIYRPYLNGTKSFYCCGDGNAEFLKNQKQCGSENYDISHLYWGSKTLLSIAGSSACWCDVMRGHNVTHPREMYEWVPRHCELLPFNGSQFCELLGNRKILLVGDSTMQQTAATLMSMIVSHGGTCADQVGHGRSDHLFFSTKGHLDLFNFVALVKPDICIMNAGPHNHDLGDMYSVVENIKNRWTELTSSSPNTKFIWKTINPGHVGCIPGMEADSGGGPTKVYTPGPEAKDQFQWNLHPIFDEIGKNYSKMLNMAGVLDMSPLYLRPDAHWDCLHYCLPGPLDIFSNILLNMLYNREV